MAGTSTDTADLHTEPTALALRLRHYRLRAGLSQQQLADFSTLSVRAIRDIENGRVARPRRGTCDLLTKVLNDDAPPASVSPQRLSREQRRVPTADPLTEQLRDRGLARNSWADGPFLGRADELDALANLYDSEHHRLITVTGIEGVGKTRLTVEFVRRSRAGGDQAVLWLPANGGPRVRGDATGNTARLAATARELLASGPVGVRRLRNAIAGRRCLIVLDGEWRTAELAGVIEELLDGCARLRIMVASRRPTGLPMESLLPLAPLSVPDFLAEPGSAGNPSDVGRFSGVRMFLAHVELRRPSFRLSTQNATTVGRICHAMDGIPAALERAARWSLVYAPEQLSQLLAMDPLAVAGAPDRGEPATCSLFASVHRTIADLTERQRRLLVTWSERAATWTVPEAAAAAGITVGGCADDVIALLTLGLVRRRDRCDRVVFQPLNIVRSLCSRFPR